MAVRKPNVLVNGRETALPAADWITGAGDLWVGSTRYESGQTRQYWNTGTTDANGRITFYPTSTGLATGTALFSTIGGFSVDAQSANTDPTAIPYFYIESISADRRTVVVRAVKGRTALITIGINYNTLEFAGAGYTCSLMLVGLP